MSNSMLLTAIGLLMALIAMKTIDLKQKIQINMPLVVCAVSMILSAMLTTGIVGFSSTETGVLLAISLILVSILSKKFREEV
jgi:hypothetical protein